MIAHQPQHHSQKTKDKISKAVSKKTEERLNKIEDAFAIGATALQACFYAGISERTYYKWLERDPRLIHRYRLIREKLPLRAKANIAKLIEAGDAFHSRWYLERHEGEEYGDVLRLKDESYALNQDDPGENDIRRKHREALKAELRARIHREADRNSKKDGDGGQENGDDITPTPAVL